MPISVRISPASPTSDLMPIARLISTIFAGGQYVEEISQSYLGNCHYDWDVSRLTWDGEKLVHHWGVWGYQMRLGKACLRVAGVGAVATDEAYRKKGLMSAAAQASLKAMREAGYDLSILRGRHYLRFGFVRAWNYVTYWLKAEEIPNRELVQPYICLDACHLHALDSLYNRDYAQYSGTAIRATYRAWRDDDFETFGWFDAQNQLSGYVRLVKLEDQQELRCVEAVGDTRQVLAILGDLFRQKNYQKLSFFSLPYGHPLLQHLRLGNCHVETQYFAPSGWRVRLVNLESSLQKLQPELETALRHSSLYAWRGRLLLEAEEQSASLSIEGGHVHIEPAQPSRHRLQAGWGLARLLIGSDEPREVIREEGIVCSGRAAELACALFPNRYPVMSVWDEY